MITLDEFCFYLVLAAFIRSLPTVLWIVVGDMWLLGV